MSENTTPTELDRKANQAKVQRLLYPALGALALLYGGYSYFFGPSRAAAPAAPQQVSAQANDALAWCQNATARTLVAQLKASYFAGQGNPVYGAAMGRFLPDGTATCAIPVTYDNPSAAQLRASMSAAEWQQMKGAMGALANDRLSETVNYRVEPMGGDNIRVSLQ